MQRFAERSIFGRVQRCAGGCLRKARVSCPRRRSQRLLRSSGPHICIGAARWHATGQCCRGPVGQCSTGGLKIVRPRRSHSRRWYRRSRYGTHGNTRNILYRNDCTQRFRRDLLYFFFAACPQKSIAVAGCLMFQTPRNSVHVLHPGMKHSISDLKVSAITSPSLQSLPRHAVGNHRAVDRQLLL